MPDMQFWLDIFHTSVLILCPERGWNRSTCVRCRVIAQVFTYHIIVSACACLCSLSAQTIGLCLSASYFSPVGWHIHTHQHSQTHTHLIYTQFLLASVKLQQFRDSKTGTIWSSLPASHFLPPPLLQWRR